MFVARSYSYTGQQHKGDKDPKVLGRDLRRSKSSKDVSAQHRGFGWRPASFAKHQEEQARTLARRHSEDRLSIRAIGIESPLVHQNALPMPSQPVAVPSASSKRSFAASDVSRKGPVAPAKHPQRSPHSKLSVASILAQTTIQPRKTFPRPRRKPHPWRRISIDDVVGEWQQAEFEHGTPPGLSPAMDALLTPPEEHDSQFGSSVDDDDDVQLPSRATSTDSMPSLQHTDSASGISSGISSSLPSTPGLMMQPEYRRVKRLGTSPKSIESSSEHPLLSLSPVEEPASEEESHLGLLRETSSTSIKSAMRPTSISRSPSRTSLPPRAKLRSRSRSLKSNLSSSLASLRNNLSRSFSNFSAPSSTEQITRSLLGTPYHPEMRPRPMSGPPTPQMRRYMNPQAIHMHDFHVHDSHIDNADLEFIAAAHAAAAEARAFGDPNAPAAPEVDVIPLDTYIRKSVSPRAGVATEAGRAMEAVTERRSSQRREPRENPEFLRIAVLEMQMRRAGKTEGPTQGGLAGPVGLPGAAVGRRGWFLPPRVDNVAAEPKVSKAQQKRWSPTTS